MEKLGLKSSSLSPGGAGKRSQVSKNRNTPPAPCDSVHSTIQILSAKLSMFLANHHERTSLIHRFPCSSSRGTERGLSSQTTLTPPTPQSSTPFYHPLVLLPIHPSNQGVGAQRFAADLTQRQNRVTVRIFRCTTARRRTVTREGAPSRIVENIVRAVGTTRLANTSIRPRFLSVSPRPRLLWCVREGHAVPTSNEEPPRRYSILSVLSASDL